MKTPEQLKGAIRNFALEKGLKPQEVLQMYLFERIIERLSQSAHRSHFILKGGLLIASMIGVESRSTLDMDTTVIGMRMDEETIQEAIQNMIQIDIGDGIQFEFKKMEPIRDDDEYNNYRVHLRAIFGKIDAPMKIDITTGDVITPSAIEYSYSMMFDEKDVKVRAYNLETILAEKYETIIRRNIGTTRARDFYDLYTLFKGQFSIIKRSDFVNAVENTARRRGSNELLREWKEICTDISNETSLERLWRNYQNDNRYAADIDFKMVADNLLEVATYLHTGE